MKKKQKPSFLFVYLLLLPVVTGLLFAASTIAKEFKTEQPKTVKPVVKDEEAQQKSGAGVVRTAGLEEQELNKLGFSTLPIFQITQLKNGPIEFYDLNAEGFFVEGVKEDLIGKCVKFSIKEKEATHSAQLLEVYEEHKRLPAEVSFLRKAPFSECSPYLGTAKNEAEQKISLEGVLERSNRPKPNTDYDYKLLFSTPTDRLDGIPIDQKVGFIYLIPGLSETWAMFEESIDKNVTVQGYLRKGYEESLYIEVENLGSGTVN